MFEELRMQLESRTELQMPLYAMSTDTSMMFVSFSSSAISSLSNSDVHTSVSRLVIGKIEQSRWYRYGSRIPTWMIFAPNVSSIHRYVADSERMPTPPM